jgi:hypothetical protein
MTDSVVVIMYGEAVIEVPPGAAGKEAVAR